MSLKRYKERFKTFFMPKQYFGYDEWILKHQVFTLLIVSFFLGLGILAFAAYRISQGNWVAGVAQLVFAFFLLAGFLFLRKEKRYYAFYSIVFFLLFFIYIHIVFFFVPQNHLNILWIVSAPVLIFFFLDKRGGLVIFFLLLGFILYLLLTGYPYTPAEYITLFAVLATTTLIMYAYEKVKEGERQRLVDYNRILQNEIDKQTDTLKKLNSELEIRVREEVDKSLMQEEMLLRQGRMASMGEMIDSIAHQWRQPLMNINVILMNLDRGISQGDTEKNLREKVSEIFSLTSHMSHTIEDFRNFMKEKKEKEIFSINEAIRDVTALIKSNFAGIVLHYEMQDDLSIASYRSELVQVLITLLSNASEVLKNKAIAQKQITIRLKKENGYARIEVEDNGGGIDRMYMEKIFDPYFTTKEQTGGTGLGLYIAKIIVEKSMEGKLLAENRNGGAVFSIIVPL
jgi:signal transduction histidine kinase